MKTKAIIGWAVAALFLGAVGLVVALPAASVNTGIGNDELLRLQGAGALVVDVRTTSEFAAGHIASAVNVPLDVLHEAAAGWDKHQAIVVYCATGARSAQAASFLASAGFTKVYNLTAGVASWSGPLVGGGPASASAGSGSVKTKGLPLLIEFATST